MLTSAIPVGGRVPVPLKMTSAMRSPRSDARALLTQHPGDGVGKIGLSATIRSHHGGHAIGKFQPRSVREGFEPEQFEFFQLVQITSSSILDSGFAISD